MPAGLYVAVVNSGSSLHLNLIVTCHRLCTSCDRITKAIGRDQDAGNKAGPRRKEEISQGLTLIIAKFLVEFSIKAGKIMKKQDKMYRKLRN